MCSVELVTEDRPATVLRLPSDPNELRSVRFLLGSNRVELNSLQPHQTNGFATLEILIQAPPALCPVCSATSLKDHNHPPPSPATPYQRHPRRQLSSLSPGHIEPEGREEEEEERRLRVREEWVKKMRGWLMVVATLVASMAFQAGINPPKVLDGNDYYYSAAIYGVFMGSNSAAFGLSLGSIILLMGENTFHGRFKLQALRVFVIGAIFALAVAFCFACYESIVLTLVFFGALFVFLVFVSMLTWWYNTKRGEAMLWRLKSIGFSRLFRRRSSIRAVDETP